MASRAPLPRRAWLVLAGALGAGACDPGARHERPAATAAATARLPSPSSNPAPAPKPVVLDLPPSPSTPPAATSDGPDDAARAPCRVALIGDSLTDFRASGGGFVRYLEARAPQSRFSNFAKGGAMVNQMRRHFEASVLAEPPGTFTHLVLFGGVNDLYSDETAGRTPAKIEKDLGVMYAAAKERGLRVVAVDVAPWGGFTKYDNPKRRAATLELNAWILDQAKSGAVDVSVDAYTLLSCGDPARLCPRYEPPHTDGLHFGKAGHEVLGKALYEAEFRRCL